MLLLRIEPMRLLAGIESEFLSEGFEAGALVIGRGFETSEHPGLTHRIGTAKDEHEGNQRSCLVTSLLQSLTSALSLVIHVPDEEDSIYPLALQYEFASHLECRAGHEGAGSPWLSVEMTLWDAYPQTARVARQLVQIEKGSTLTVRGPVVELPDYVVRRPFEQIT